MFSEEFEDWRDFAYDWLWIWEEHNGSIAGSGNRWNVGQRWVYIDLYRNQNEIYTGWSGSLCILMTS